MFTNNDQFRNGTGAIVILAALGCLAVWTGTKMRVPELVNAWRAGSLRPAGGPQLVSYEPMPAMEGESCEWKPVKTESTLFASMVRQEKAGTGDFEEAQRVEIA